MWKRGVRARSRVMTWGMEGEDEGEREARKQARRKAGKRWEEGRRPSGGMNGGGVQQACKSTCVDDCSSFTLELCSGVGGIRSSSRCGWASLSGSTHAPPLSSTKGGCRPTFSSATMRE